MNHIDPYYNSLYAQTHGKELYGTSSIAFLPEVMQAFLNYAAQGKIDPSGSIRVLDYGCGRSILLDVFTKVVNEERETVEAVASQELPLRKAMTSLAPALQNAMAGYERGEYERLLTWDGGIIEKNRFDPAIPEYSDNPNGKYDFLICTDVYEHIPENSSNCEITASPLRSTMDFVSKLSDNPFLNISLRQAMQILPDGQNAHCTLKSPQDWLNEVKQHTPSAIPMLSRDFTSSHIISGPGAKGFTDVSYDNLETYGEVDLIPYPPKKTYSEEKLASLQSIQPHKAEVRRETIEWWKNHVDCALQIAL